MKKIGENIVNATNKKDKILRLLLFILGCFIVSVAYNIFVVPNKIVPGGVGGIAIILNSILGINNALTILVLNIILLIISHFTLGYEKTRASLLGTIVLPLFIKLTESINVWIQIDTSQILLSVLFGGILYGLGAGIVFKTGFTTGGTDIINQIISKYAKKSMGESMLRSDGLIVLSSGVFLGLYNMLYSILILYIISIMSDRILLGISDNKMFYILTDNEDEIKKYIIDELNHGVTTFKATGGFGKEKKSVIMTVLPTEDYYVLKEGIHKIDKEAFFIVTDSYEVFGGE